MLTVPHRSEEAVGKPHDKHVLHELLAQVVINSAKDKRIVSKPLTKSKSLKQILATNLGELATRRCHRLASDKTSVWPGIEHRS